MRKLLIMINVVLGVFLLWGFAKNVAASNTQNAKKNQIKLLRAALQIEEGIRLHGIEVLDAELLRRATNEIVMHGIDLDRSDALHAARGELVADRARTGKEVEDIALLEIDQVLEDIKEVLLGKVGRGACTEVTGRVDCTPFQCSADYSHITLLKCRL